jgi:hypothetical protein
MTDSAAYLLTCRPLTRAVIGDFFNPYGDVFALLSRPPETREGSFGMRMAALPELHQAEYWEVDAREMLTGRVRRLRVYVDGTILFRASADQSFLCWPEVRDVLRVNPVVVADSALSFCAFVRAVVLLMSTRPEKLEIGVALPNVALSEPPIRMYAGNLREGLSIHTIRSDQLRGVGESSPKREFTVDTKELLEGNDNPFVVSGRVAYMIVRGVYDMFGFSESAIPYVEGEGDQRRIALELYNKRIW